MSCLDSKNQIKKGRRRLKGAAASLADQSPPRKGGGKGSRKRMAGKGGIRKRSGLG